MTASIRNRLCLWRHCDYDALWNQYRKQRKRPFSRAMTDAERRSRNVSRDLRLAHQGAYGKSVQALTYDGVHFPNDEMVQELLQKQPQQAPESDGTFPIPTLLPFNPTPFVPGKMDLTIKAFPKASAGGATGLTPLHLQQMVAVPSTDVQESILASLIAYVNHLAQAKLLDIFGPRHAAS